MNDSKDTQEVALINFNSDAFKTYLENLIYLYKNIEELISAYIEEKYSSKSKSIEFNQASILEKQLEEIDDLIALASNYDFYDGLILGCLAGSYYDISSNDWKIYLEVLNVIPQKNIKHKASLDSYNSINSIQTKPEVPSDTDASFSDYFDIEYSILVFEEAVLKIIESVSLFATLSQRLVFDDNTTVNDIQAKHFDFALKGKLDAIRVLLSQSNDKEALFIINLRLAELDEFLSCENSFLDELSYYLIILYELYDRKNEFDNLVLITKNKCQYLIYKILKRIDRSSKLANDGISISIFYNQKQIQLSTKKLESILKEEKSPYICFLEKSNLIYDPNISENALKDKIDSIESLHIDCKVFKRQIEKGRVFGSKKESKKYKATFDKIKNGNNKHLETFESKTVTQKFALISYEYLINNISYKYEIESIINEFTCLEDLNRTIDKFIGKYNEYSKKCDFENNNRLIFPNLQHIRYFIQGVEKLLEKVKSVIVNTRNIFDLYELERVELSIREIAECINIQSKLYFKHLQFLRNKNFYPVYNDIKLCFSENEAKFRIYMPSLKTRNNPYIFCSSSLFLDSSYVLPSNYSYLKFNMEELIRNINNENSQILSSLEVFFSRNVEKSLDVKIKENQFNAIQTLSVYAIIITFILGSISALPKFEQGIKVLPYFMLLLGFILGFFILCIRFLFINEQFILGFGKGRKLKIPRFLVYSIFLISLVLITFLYSLPKYESLVNHPENDINQTKIHTNNTRILYNFRHNKISLEDSIINVKDSFISIKK